MMPPLHIPIGAIIRAVAVAVALLLGGLVNGGVHAAFGPDAGGPAPVRTIRSPTTTGTTPVTTATATTPPTAGGPDPTPIMAAHTTTSMRTSPLHTHSPNRRLPRRASGSLAPP